ncbi:hypothetical protein [Janthinobacterium sp. 35]|uniref:hypothetical protein n=1 Tax=Janthinobacterium sp. 35 TaxID=2035210 RepID=UPI00117AC009|nr:hypothetical protein [Janthinobacterium sp. 35]
MKFSIHDYVNNKGVNEFKRWTESLQQVQRGKLRERIDKLMLHGDTLFPEMLAGTSVAGVQKLKVHGKVQLRPLLCKGPIYVHQEYTMLLGAKEVGNEWEPGGAPEAAKSRKNEVAADPKQRRKSHERVR